MNQNPLGWLPRKARKPVFLATSGAPVSVCANPMNLPLVYRCRQLMRKRRLRKGIQEMGRKQPFLVFGGRTASSSGLIPRASDEFTNPSGKKTKKTNPPG